MSGYEPPARGASVTIVQSARGCSDRWTDQPCHVGSLGPLCPVDRSVGVVVMADEKVSDTRCPDLSKGLGPQALCNSHFEGLRCVSNDLEGQSIFPEVTGISRLGIVVGTVELSG